VTIDEDRLGAALVALADPTRRAILAQLAKGEATVNELAERFPVTQQSISRHLGVLRRCHLITQRVDGPRRPSRVNVDTMTSVIDWLTDQKNQWEDRLDVLEVHLDRMQGKAKR
jgi:DNA-binding transcriptional ArsR family regulator